MTNHIGKLYNLLKYQKPQLTRGIHQSLMMKGSSLMYHDYGEPVNVLKLTDVADQPAKEDEIVVKWLLAPINPSDINTIQGKYPSRPELPAVPGNEGVGEILTVGSRIKDFQVGDKVVPNGNNKGTWRSSAVYHADDLLKIPSSIGNVEASMLNVNPCSAYRMLKDFVALKPGDTVIQNGGNSAVGQFVIQLCKIWNLNSVNVVRDRENINELKDHLKGLGAHHVLTENEVRTTDLFKSKKLSAPKLALNCVCGQNALDTLRHLAQDGIIVTYGAMAREPLIIPASALIFKNISAKGFWMTAWVKQNPNSEERWNMVKELGDLFESKKLQLPPYKIIPISKYQDAVSNALKLDGKIDVKYILDLSS